VISVSLVANRYATERSPMPRPAQQSPELLLRGSLIRLSRKCGKPSCYCAKGAPHETPALSSSIGGVTKILTLRREDLPEVRAAIGRYNKALAELERRALAGIARLRQRLEKEKAQMRGRRP